MIAVCFKNDSCTIVTPDRIVYPGYDINLLTEVKTHENLL